MCSIFVISNSYELGCFSGLKSSSGGVLQFTTRKLQQLHDFWTKIIEFSFILFLLMNRCSFTDFYEIFQTQVQENMVVYWAFTTFWTLTVFSIKSDICLGKCPGHFDQWASTCFREVMWWQGNTFSFGLVFKHVDPPFLKGKYLLSK